MSTAGRVVVGGVSDVVGTAAQSRCCSETLDKLFGSPCRKDSLSRISTILQAIQTCDSLVKERAARELQVLFSPTFSALGPALPARLSGIVGSAWKYAMSRVERDDWKKLYKIG
jgi:hypothetical protein